MEALQDCFECTDQDMFKASATDNHHTRMEEYAESVSANIQKCMDDVSVMKNITARANEKPWMSSEVRAMLKVRNVAFKSGDMVANFNCAITVAKCAQKVQDFFHDPTNTR